MANRTLMEIERDFRKIQNIVDTTNVSSLSEIADELGLTIIEVKICLACYPRLGDKILLLLKNRSGLKANTKPKKEVLESPKNNQHEVAYEIADTGFILDASITGLCVTRKRKTSTQPNFRKQTLFAAKKVGDRLLITNFYNDYRSIWVISNGIEYTSGIYELKIGDNVYLATKKPDFFTFAHYQCVSLSAKNNCILLFSKRIYNTSEISELPKGSYKTFMRSFKRRYD